MRFAIFLLITSLFIVSYGCSKEEPYEPEKKSISIWEGETSHISIETDLTHCNCALQSEDQEIATATIDKNRHLHHYTQKWKYHDTASG